jgi:hypothetical protein
MKIILMYILFHIFILSNGENDPDISVEDEDDETDYFEKETLTRLKRDNENFLKSYINNLKNVINHLMK